MLWDESRVFLALVLNRASVRDYEKREECGSLTTRAPRTVPSQAVKHILVLFTHIHTHTSAETDAPLLSNSTAVGV